MSVVEAGLPESPAEPTPVAPAQEPTSPAPPAPSAESRWVQLARDDSSAGIRYQPLTPFGDLSLQTGRPVFHNASDDLPPLLKEQASLDQATLKQAAMAVPFRLGGASSRPSLAGSPQPAGATGSLALFEAVDDTPYRYWSEDERRLVEQVTDQLSLALENAFLFQDEQRRRQIADTLSEIARVVGATLDLHEVTENLLDQLPNLVDFNSASLQLIEGNIRTLIGGRGFDVEAEMRKPSQLHRLIEDDPLIAQVIRTHQPVVLSDTHQDARWEVYPETAHVRSWIAAPMIAGAEVLGLLIMDHTRPGEYTAETAQLATAFTAQAAVAIRNARLFEQVQAAYSQTERMYRASADMSAVQTHEEILDILRQATILGHPNASNITVNLFERPWEWEDPSGRPEWYIPIALWTAVPSDAQRNTRYPLSSWATAPNLLLPDQPTIIEDATTSSILDDTARSVYLDILRAKSILLVPLNVGGQWIGHISAAYGAPTLFPEEEIRNLMALAGQAAVAIQNLRLIEEIRRRAAQLQTAAEIARDTSSTLALDVLLSRSVNLIRERYGFYHASIFLLDETGQNAVVRESTGLAGEEMKRRGHSLQVGSQSIIGYVTAHGESLVVNDVSKNPNHRPNPLLPDTRAESGIPLKRGSRVLGALDVQATKVDAFTPDDIAVLQTLADQIAIALDNAQAYELAQQAVAETRQRVQEISSLYDVSQAIASATMQSEEIAQTIAIRFVDTLGETTGVDRAAVYLYDILEDELAPMTVITQADVLAFKENEFYSPPFVQEEPLPLSNYPGIERVMQSLQPVVLVLDYDHLIVAPGQTIPRHIARPSSSERSYMTQQGFDALVIIPLAVKGQSMGVVVLSIRRAYRQPSDAERDSERSQSAVPGVGFSVHSIFTSSLLNLMMTMANAAAVALENARLYEEQLQTSEKLRELDLLKSQFLANMSHELRTPLNSIIGFSRVILKGIDGPISDLQQQDLTAIHNAGTHLLQLINDVLDISKIEAGKMELAFDDHVNVADIINSAMSTAIGLTKDKPIKLVKEIVPDLPGVRADPTRIRQVVINFLSNASKFTEAGSITVRAFVGQIPGKAELRPAELRPAELRPREGRPELVVSVSDTGPGIGREDQARLFQPFSQVDSSPTRKVGGTGLGLSISRMLIDLHQGRIGVESEPGKGSTFYFTLPLPVEVSSDDSSEAETEKEGAAVNEQDNRETASGADQAQSLPSSSKPRILIIDDDRQIVKLYERYLQEHGYEVHALNDPMQALQVVKELQPFAITLDIMMPRKDGWQVLETLKADPETKDIPVIICSIVEGQDKGFSLGATDYLMKPILGDDLVKAIHRLNGDGAIREVLVVDDDADDLRLVQRILEEKTDYRVRTALGGPEGLVAVQTQPPHAIILDLFMPGLDGFTLLQTVRADPQLRHIPVIIFTAGDLTEEQKAHLAQFSQEMLLKTSFKEEELLSTIENVLSRIQILL